MLARSLFLVIFVALVSSVARAEPQHTKDPLDKVKQQVNEKKAVLVDVREPSEWDKGHVDGAILVPLGELAKKSKDPAFVAELEKKLPKDTTVYCHCAKGKRRYWPPKCSRSSAIRTCDPWAPAMKSC